MIGMLLFIIFGGFLCAAAAWDFLELKVPNVLTASFAAAGLCVAALHGADILIAALGAGGAVFLLGWLLFVLRVMGGGDGKLMAATAVWLGPLPLVDFAVLIGLFGGALAGAILLFRNAGRAPALLGPVWRERLAAPHPPVPYAMAIAPAGVAAFLRHSQPLL